MLLQPLDEDIDIHFQCDNIAHAIDAPRGRLKAQAELDGEAERVVDSGPVESEEGAEVDVGQVGDAVEDALDGTEAVNQYRCARDREGSRVGGEAMQADFVCVCGDEEDVGGEHGVFGEELRNL